MMNIDDLKLSHLFFESPKVLLDFGRLKDWEMKLNMKAMFKWKWPAYLRVWACDSNNTFSVSAVINIKSNED